MSNNGFEPKIVAFLCNWCTYAAADTAGVATFHAFRAREIGGRVAVDVHVQVDGNLTVHEGHDIASAVKARVLEAGPAVMDVIVHIEPMAEGAQS